MKTSDYRLMERYMLACMQDSAHDREHIYRVLYAAMEIAGYEEGVNDDVLIAACLLHDIGRQEQLENPALCHAAIGAKKARDFLMRNGFPAEYARQVASCIERHRFRSDRPPVTLEAKILFDADKLDAAGALGIARTLVYKGQVGEPLYSLDEAGAVSDGTEDPAPSFFQEYKHKLERVYSGFYTARGRALASVRQREAAAFYESMLRETRALYHEGGKRLSEKLTK